MQEIYNNGGLKKNVNGLDPLALSFDFDLAIFLPTFNLEVLCDRGVDSDLFPLEA